MLTGIELDEQRYLGASGGCVGVHVGAPGLSKWMNLMKLYAASSSNLLAQLPDEWALGTVVNMGLGKVVGSRWSAIPPRNGEPWQKPPPDSAAVHFAVRRYRRKYRHLWGPAAARAIKADFLGFRDNYTRYLICNRLCMKAVNLYLREYL